MARAKSTDRAEARRRHRAIAAEAALAAAATESADDADGGTASVATATATSTAAATSRSTSPRPPTPPKSATKTGSAKATADQPQERPSIVGAFKAALRPVDLRSDIAYIPELVLHTRAVWVPSLAVIGAGVLALIAPANQITQLVAQVFVAPPSLAGPFLAGLLATRASYLAGGIVGIVAAVVLTIAILLIPSALFNGPVDRQAIITYSLLVSPIFGLAVGGFAGYYRRFLAASSPNRQRRQATAKSSNSNRSTAKRR